LDDRNDRKEIRSWITAAMLLYLYERGPLSTSELAELIGVDTKTLSPYLYYYNNKGWVARQSYTWALTPLGREIVRKYRKQLKRILNSFRYKESTLSSIKISKDFSRANQFSKDRLENRLIPELLKRLDELDLQVIRAFAVRRLLSEQANICVRDFEELRRALIIINAALERCPEDELLDSLRKLELLGVVRRFVRRRERDHCFKLNEKVLEYVRKNLYTSVLL